jgi:23S rRNA (cytosine1962-C5)-methyltransferase
LSINWYLKKGLEKKFRAGHPWVFSNELAQSPKGIASGALVELRDAQGGFLARGYGHPNSLISFRVLTRDEKTPIDVAFFKDKLGQAMNLRKVAGVSGFSHRLCFAEGDYLPGLVIDRFLLEGGAQVFVLQSSTAGMDALIPHVFGALEELVNENWGGNYSGPSWNETALIVANDSKSRAMENIGVEPKVVKKAIAGFTPEDAKLVLEPGVATLKPVIFSADLIGGQKTGFFLDQRMNVQLTSRYVASSLAGRKELRVLDLCCYVGQWGTQLSHLVSSLGGGIKANVTCVDSSAKALEIAVRNVEAHGGIAKAMKMDVLQNLETLDRRAYDVVICDPPAFIKKKKDLPTGSQAYFKLNREAIRRTAASGLFVSCSCSGLFTEEDFREMLSRTMAAYTAGGGSEVRWLSRGGHSPDHPQRPEFPQGSYLKSWIGLVR